MDRLRRNFDHDLAMADEGNEPQLIGNLCAEMTLETLPIHFSLLRSLDVERYGTDLQQRLDLAIHLRLLELDPDEALINAQRNWTAESGAATGEVLETKMEILLTQLAGKFHDRAVRHYYDLTCDQDRHVMLRTLGIKDPFFALAELEKLPASEQRRNTLAHLIDQQIVNQPDPSAEFVKWNEAVKDHQLASQLQLEIISQTHGL